eukprot:scaffold19848_cov56-Phaeocystis_antarctica.AAC.1
MGAAEMNNQHQLKNLPKRLAQLPKRERETISYLSHEQTTVRKPDHCAAGAGSTGQSKQRAGSGRGGLVAGL